MTDRCHLGRVRRNPTLMQLLLSRYFQAFSSAPLVDKSPEQPTIGTDYHGPNVF